jgi:hypothetical protein
MYGNLSALYTSRYNRELHSLKLLSLYCKQDLPCVASSTVGKCKLINTFHTIKQQARTQYKSIILSIKTDSLYILGLQSATAYMSIYLTYSNEISNTFTVNCSKLSRSRYLQLIGLLTKCSTERSNTGERKFSRWTKSWAKFIHRLPLTYFSNFLRIYISTFRDFSPQISIPRNILYISPNNSIISLFHIRRGLSHSRGLTGLGYIALLDNKSPSIQWTCLHSIRRCSSVRSSVFPIEIWVRLSLWQMSIRNFPGSKWRMARKADNLTAICEPIVWRKCGSLDVSQHYGHPQLITGIALPIFI